MSDVRTRILLSSLAGLIVAGLGMTYVRVSRASSEPPQAQQSPTLAPAPPQGAGDRNAIHETEGAGSTIFGNTCEQCHGKIESAPSPALLKKMTPEHIYMELTTGSMVQN